MPVRYSNLLNWFGRRRQDNPLPTSSS